MSIRARLNVRMTNKDVIRKMCERRGWQLQERGPRMHFKVADHIFGNVVVDTRTGSVDYDTDVARQAHKNVVGDDVRCRDGNMDQQIADMLDINYGEAAAIMAAEKDGRKWREGTTDNGYSWIEVEKPVSKEEELAAIYE